MGGVHEGRLVQLVEQAHPRRIARHADEWERCSRILEQAAGSVEAAALRHTEIGGQTGPAMARAFVIAAEVLRVKARDLDRGSDALRTVAAATEATRNEKHRIDRDHPDDGQHFVVREEGSRQAADSQENALRHGIRVMKSIQVGDDPRSAGITVVAPEQVVVTGPPTGWPTPPVDTGPASIGLQPGDPGWDDPDDLDVSPHGSGPVSLASTSSPSPGVLGGSGAAVVIGAGVLGAAGLAAGVRAAGAKGAAPAGVAPGAPRPIGAGGAAASAGTLGRGPQGAGGQGAGSQGGRRSGSTSAGVSGAGRRRSRTDDEQTERDLHDDGQGWLDDEAGPDVLR